MFTSQTFDGKTYDHKRDGKRLNTQYESVFEKMRDGGWYTLDDLARASGGTVASVSARLRDMRKPRFGSHTVNRRYVTNGLYEYQLVVNLAAQAA